MKIFSDSEDAKKFISENIKNIPDQAFANVLRDIIFGNNIDWHKANMSISRNMPEAEGE